MNNDEYYDIDSILAEHSKIPCIFLHDIDASVNLSGDGNEIAANSRVELPFWMAKVLAQYRLPNGENLVTIELPRAYGTRVRNSLDASPTSIDFRQVSPYFYQFGTKLYDLIIDDQLPATLEKTFKARLKEIMNISLTGSTNVGQDFLQKLDETEKELFKAGQESTAESRKWRHRRRQQLKPVSLGHRISSQSSIS
ncbi:putative DNA replication complex GINS protein psf3 [Circinella umbellata]|nr:putative DNA replication complex GINS protein psf3 [Circinella umbellata]